MPDESLQYINESKLQTLYQLACNNLAFTLEKIAKHAEDAIPLQLNNERKDLLQCLANLETEFERRGLSLPAIGAIDSQNISDSTSSQQSKPLRSSKTFNFHGSIGRVNISDTYNEYSDLDDDS